jgi:hypothetical protein
VKYFYYILLSIKDSLVSIRDLDCDSADPPPRFPAFLRLLLLVVAPGRILSTSCPRHPGKPLAIAIASAAATDHKSFPANKVPLLRAENQEAAGATSAEGIENEETAARSNPTRHAIYYSGLGGGEGTTAQFGRW